MLAPLRQRRAERRAGPVGGVDQPRRRLEPDARLGTPPSRRSRSHRHAPTEPMRRRTRRNRRPSSRAPIAPASIRHSTSASSSGVDTSMSSRDDAWLASIERPERVDVARTQRVAERAHAHHLGHRVRARGARRAPDRASRRATPAGRGRRRPPGSPTRRCAYGLPSSVRGTPECTTSTRIASGKRQRLDLERAAVDEQRVPGPPEHRRQLVLVPHGTPVAMCSARCAASARSWSGSEKPATSSSASATATSNAALDDEPGADRNRRRDVEVGADGRATEIGEHRAARRRPRVPTRARSHAGRRSRRPRRRRCRRARPTGRRRARRCAAEPSTTTSRSIAIETTQPSW